MKMKKISLILTTLVLAAVLGASAAPDGALGGIYDAGRALLFETDNVTLTGNAVFSCDGERFKTVEAKYVQDGYDSLWQYDLYTPREPDDVRYGSGDRKSGFTVIGNAETNGTDLYVLDNVYPGTYRSGYEDRQDSLVRRSARLDQLVSLAGIVIRQAEPLLGADAVTVLTDNDAGKTVRIRLDEGNISELVNGVFNLCAQSVVSHMFKPVDFESIPYDHYSDWGTLADELAVYAERYSLAGADITVTVDGNGRLRSVKGTIAADVQIAGKMQYGFDRVLAAGSRPRIDVSFDVGVSAYGTSHVDRFDPQKAGVKPFWEAMSWTEEEPEPEE